MVRRGEYIEAGEGHVQVGGMGLYSEQELGEAIAYHRSDPGSDESREALPKLTHLQGALFDTDKLNTENRGSLMNQRIRTSGRGKLGRTFRKVGELSTIPVSHLQSRDPIEIGPGQTVKRPETRLLSASGRYRREEIATDYLPRDPATGKRPIRKVLMDSDSVSVGANDWNPVGTLVHEMGHRHHISSFPRGAPEAWGMARDQGADSLLEAHADAYVDRYLGNNVDSVRAYRERKPGGKRWAGLEATGYSTNFKGDRLRGEQWSPEDAALYAAARAHSGATGEMVPYRKTMPHPLEKGVIGNRVSSRDVTVDATLHHLLSTSQHAKQALRQTSQTQIEGKKQTTVALKGVGGEAFRRHRDRQLLKQGQEVQDPLWHDPTLSHNQFGEKPRTVADVSQTLNIPEHHFNMNSHGLLFPDGSMGVHPGLRRPDD